MFQFLSSSFGLVWFGFVLFGSAWFGFVLLVSFCRFRLVWFRLVGFVSFGFVSFGFVSQSTVSLIHWIVIYSVDSDLFGG